MYTAKKFIFSTNCSKKNTSLTSRFSFSHLRRIFKKEFQKPVEFLQLKLFPTLEQLYILFQKNKIKLRELYPSASLCVRFPNNVSAFAIYTWLSPWTMFIAYLFEMRMSFGKSLWTINGNFWLRQISRWTQKDIIPEKRLIQTIFNSCAIAQCSNMCWVYGRNHGMPEENYSIKWVEFLCVCVRVETYGKWDHPVIPSSIIQFTQFG